MERGEKSEFEIGELAGVGESISWVLVSAASLTPQFGQKVESSGISLPQYIQNIAAPFIKAC